MCHADALEACCEAVVERLKTDSPDGQLKSDQANAKSVCLSYKKAPAVSSQQPGATGRGRKLLDPYGAPCYAIETDYKVRAVLEMYRR
jgi:hypothetical protein